MHGVGGVDKPHNPMNTWVSTALLLEIPKSSLGVTSFPCKLPVET